MILVFGQTFVMHVNCVLLYRQGDVQVAILSNYMVDIDWLTSGEFDKQSLVSA